MDTILFDLDGTLLPMDMDAFLKRYMSLLGRYCAGLGYDAKKTTDAVWKGTGAMMKNDGGATNEERFWSAFADIMGPEVMALRPELEKFYETDFHGAKETCGANPLAAPLVRKLRAAGLRLVLATNPMFPQSAVRSRLSWVGLKADDFDHITCYDNCHYCKPNPAYFREILKATGTDPARCLMVGNDVDDDGAAAEAGLDLFFVTDHLINASGSDISRWESGSFAQLSATLGALADEMLAG